MKPWLDLPMTSSNMPVTGGDLKPLPRLMPLTDMALTSALIMKADKTVDDLRGIYKMLSGKPENHFLPSPENWQQLQAEDEAQQREELYWCDREERGVKDGEEPLDEVGGSNVNL